MFYKPVNNVPVMAGFYGPGYRRYVIYLARNSVCKMSEHKLQTAILSLSRGLVRLFRANSGNAWQGKSRRLAPGETYRAHGGEMLLAQPRRVQLFPQGTSDLIGWRSVEITPDMVGQRLAQFVAIEVKTTRGQLTQEQAAFLTIADKHGALARVARSVEDAERGLFE